MKVIVSNISKEKLLERKGLIDELLNSDIDIENIELDMNEENIKVVKEIVQKYRKVLSSDWDRPTEIMVANSDQEIIATIRS